jgi:hypothetical protein
VIPVTVNGRGPFDFMVDTGSQVTVVDPSLAQELGLKPQGTVVLVSTASYARASGSVLDLVKAGGQAVGHSLAVVQDLGQIQVPILASGECSVKSSFTVPFGRSRLSSCGTGAWEPGGPCQALFWPASLVEFRGQGWDFHESRFPVPQGRREKSLSIAVEANSPLSLSVVLFSKRVRSV